MLTRIGGLATAILLAALAVGASAWAAPGDLDPSFGQDGRVQVQTNPGCLRGCVEFGGSYAVAVALQPDGGIVLGGRNDYIGAPVPYSERTPPGALVRLSLNGTLDTSFGDTGGGRGHAVCGRADRQRRSRWAGGDGKWRRGDARSRALHRHGGARRLFRAAGGALDTPAEGVPGRAARCSGTDRCARRGYPVRDRCGALHGIGCARCELWAWGLCAASSTSDTTRSRATARNRGSTGSDTPGVCDPAKRQRDRRVRDGFLEPQRFPAVWAAALLSSSA